MSQYIYIITTVNHDQSEIPPPNKLKCDWNYTGLLSIWFSPFPPTVQFASSANGFPEDQMPHQQFCLEQQPKLQGEWNHTWCWTCSDFMTACPGEYGLSNPNSCSTQHDCRHRTHMNSVQNPLSSLHIDWLLGFPRMDFDKPKDAFVNGSYQYQSKNHEQWSSETSQGNQCK